MKKFGLVHDMSEVRISGYEKIEIRGKNVYYLRRTEAPESK